MTTPAASFPADRLADHTAASLQPWAPVASAIVAARLWCVIEACTDAAGHEWEPRLVIFRTDAEGISEAIADWVATAPTCGARIAGYTRDRLRRVDSAPTALCHVVNTAGHDAVDGRHGTPAPAGSLRASEAA